MSFYIFTLFSLLESLRQRIILLNYNLSEYYVWFKSVLVAHLLSCDTSCFSSSYKNLQLLSLLPLFSQVYLDALLIYMCGSAWSYNPELVRDRSLESSTDFKSVALA